MVRSVRLPQPPAAARKDRRRWLRAVCALASGLGGAVGLMVEANAQVVPDQMPPPVRGLEVANHLGQSIPLDLPFRDEDGNVIMLRKFFPAAPAVAAPAPAGTAAETGASAEWSPPVGAGATKPGVLGGKPVVIVMHFYRCPILCPVVLDKFTKCLDEVPFTVGTEFDVVMVSFDPRDLPADAARLKTAQLLSYKRDTTDSIRAGWNFLTSEPANARKLADALGFPYRFFPKADDFSHPSVVFVLTPEGRISRYLTGLEYPARDVRLALLEASNGKIGGVFDRFTLWCYHFDPAAGSYTLQAMRVMQVCSAGVAAGIGVLLFFMFRLEGRRRRSALPPEDAAGADGPDVAPPTVSTRPAVRRSHRPCFEQRSPVHPPTHELTGQA